MKKSHNLCVVSDLVNLLSSLLHLSLLLQSCQHTYLVSIVIKISTIYTTITKFTHITPNQNPFILSPFPCFKCFSRRGVTLPCVPCRENKSIKWLGRHGSPSKDFRILWVNKLCHLSVIFCCCCCWNCTKKANNRLNKCKYGQTVWLFIQVLIAR